MIERTKSDEASHAPTCTSGTEKTKQVPIQRIQAPFINTKLRSGDVVTAEQLC